MALLLLRIIICLESKGTSGSRSVSMMTAEDNGTGEFYTIQAAFRAYTGYKESLKDYIHLLRTGIEWEC